MFAVPGWSVSSSSLKRQTVEPPAPKPATNNTPTTDADGEPKPNKKRKRSSGKSKASDVNSANVADLYEEVIEGKPKVVKAKSKEQSEKRQKISQDDSPEDEADAPPNEKKKHEKQKKSKTLKEKRREKKAALEQSTDPSNPEAPSTKPTPQTSVIPSKPLPQLTPLQAAMRQKLVSARFRHLNQTLYTTPSAHSLDLFQENPEMFTEYHEGFRRQVEVWPENPVDSYIADIKTRSLARTAPPKSTSASETIIPLPRTEKICRIADLGCGDAALSSALQKDAKKLHLQIHSFDLHSPSPLVTRADIANLPLEEGSVDIAIFCLALMGTNWIDFIEEAFRVLRWKGELWVAEIKSRFGRVGGKKGGGRVEHSVGYRQKTGIGKKEKKRVEEEEGVRDDAALMVEVDGNEEAKQETDVSAFVEVLRKRGFVLKGEGAVDLSNRMFVKMHFVKGVTPIKGKCVPVPKGMEKMGLETWKKKPKKFLEAEEDVPVSSEAGVLKPCVYKLR